MSEEYFDEDGDVIRKPDNHVVWKNAQWAITEDGYLSALWCGYHIDPHSLRGLGHGLPWHEHVARKTWIDMMMFNQAFREAVKRNGLAISEEQIEEWEASAEQYLSDRTRTPRYMERSLEYYGFWQ